MGSGKKRVGKVKAEILATILINKYTRRKILRTAEEIAKDLAKKKLNSSNNESS